MGKKPKKKKKKDPNRIDFLATPVMEIHRLREELWAALSKQKWKTVTNRAKGIIKLLALAMDPKTCKIGNGVPHLDGVYTIGIHHILHAPQKAKETILEMNRLIRLGKSKKWPKPKKKSKKKKR